MHLFIQREVCFLSALREGNTFTAACVILSVITKQDVLVEPTVTSRGGVILELSSIALFPVSLTLSLFLKMSCHHLSLPFPVVVCFLVLLDPLLESPCWALQRALPHHGNSKLSGWLHHVTKCFMSLCELSLFPCFSPPLRVNTACFVTLRFKQRKERTGKKKGFGT